MRDGLDAEGRGAINEERDIVGANYTCRDTELGRSELQVLDLDAEGAVRNFNERATSRRLPVGMHSEAP